MTPKALVTVAAFFLLNSPLVIASESAEQLPNTLSEQEQQDGWVLLFDGSTTKGWRSTRSVNFPEIGWVIENGELVVLPAPGDANHSGGDIITTREYANFELSLEFKLSEGANSGIKYFMDPNLLKEKGSALGLEYSILDDAVHPDAKMDAPRHRGSNIRVQARNPFLSTGWEP